MTNRGVLAALILAYYFCLGLVSWSLIGIIGFTITYFITGQIQYGFAVLICAGSMIGFSVAAAVAHWWARA